MFMLVMNQEKVTQFIWKLLVKGFFLEHELCVCLFLYAVLQ